MVNNRSPKFDKNSLEIKQDDKFFSRLASKENSASNPSFRIYYGNVSGAVPFTWEIQPGTPKHKFSTDSIPPLTPPPSYYISNPDRDLNKPMKTKYYQRSRMLFNFFLNINLINKGHGASSLPSSLSSSSWSSLMSSTGRSSKASRSRGSSFSSFGSSFDDGHVYSGGSPDSMTCFGMNNTKSNYSNARASTYTIAFIKKAFLSIVGRISG